MERVVGDVGQVRRECQIGRVGAARVEEIVVGRGIDDRAGRRHAAGVDADEPCGAGRSEIAGEVDPPEGIGPHVTRGPGHAPPQHPAGTVDIDRRDKAAHSVHGQHQAARGVEHVTVVDLAGVAEREWIEQIIIVVGGRAGPSIEQVGNTERVARPHRVVVGVRHQVQNLAARGP